MRLIRRLRARSKHLVSKASIIPEAFFTPSSSDSIDTPDSDTFSTSFPDLGPSVCQRVIKSAPWSVLSDLSCIKDVRPVVDDLRGTPVRRVIIVMFGDVPGIEISALNTLITLQVSELEKFNPREVYINGYSTMAKTSKITSCAPYTTKWCPEVMEINIVAFEAEDFLKIVAPGIMCLNIVNCSITPMPPFGQIAHLFADAVKLELHFRNAVLHTEDILALAKVRNAVNKKTPHHNTYDIKLWNVDAHVDPDALIALFPVKCLKGTTIDINFENIISAAIRKKMERVFSKKANRAISLSMGLTFLTMSK